ncbi:MAG TPA: relaxase/mobilization nuclease domain-containing protein [Nitrosomonas sp.]|nr:relaxase/mobilization nuclease domain-containing protein [Nitrosomonas sp.]
MLAKVPAKRNDGKTSFKSLGKYACERDHIDPETGEVSRYQCSTETNCLDTETAWREMKAVADMNGRVKDPVYHFTVSWPAHENPTDLQVFEAGRAGMEALGMGEHQYLAAVHRDTDNIHGHFMVNRIHPETYRSVYPDRDFYKLDKVMREVELKQGWSHDNGVYSVHERNGKKVVDWTKDKKEIDHSKDKTPAKARQMEAMTGSESIATYAQSEPKKAAIEVLKNGGGWQELHTTLKGYGLDIKPKGQGFVIGSINDESITPIKASTMAEQLGAGKLKKLIGEYQPPLPEKAVVIEKQYNTDTPKRDPNLREQKRLERGAERQALRERYKVYETTFKQSKKPAKDELYNTHKAKQKALIDDHKKRRDAVLKSGLSVAERKAEYSVLALDSAKKREALSIEIQAEREAFKLEKVQPFREWVADRAGEGDKAAISQLRGWHYEEKRRGKAVKSTDQPHLTANGIDDKEVPQKPTRILDNVTWQVDRKTGEVTYSINQKTAFIDEGKRLNFLKSEQGNREAVAAGLLLAREKFGESIVVNGNDDFKRLALELAVEKNIAVKFTDPALENRRLELIKQRQKAPFTPKEIEAILGKPQPSVPNREVVEQKAISEHLEAYRSNLIKRLIEAHGERPDSSQGGFIGRIATKRQAEKWDKHFGEIEQKIKDRRELLNSAEPKAVQFKADAWQKAYSDYERACDERQSAWEQAWAQEQKATQERQNREAEAKVLAAKMSQKVGGQAPSRTGKDRSNDIEI